MTPEEVQRILDAKADRVLARSVAESYLPLVLRVAGRVAARYHLQPRELHGAGVCGVYDAIGTWREDGGAAFLTHAWTWVWKRVIEEAKTLSCSTPRAVEPFVCEDEEEREAARMDVDRLIVGLPQDEAHFVVAVYLRGQTISEAASSIGAHRNTARTTLARGIERMRKAGLCNE